MCDDVFRGYLRLAVRLHIVGLKPEYAECLMEILHRLEEDRPVNIRAMASELGLKYATLYERIGRALHALASTMSRDRVLQNYIGSGKTDHTFNVVSRLIEIDRLY